MEKKSLEIEIKKLREEGYTYNQIKNKLNCSKSVISYHLSEKGKIKTINRTKNNKKTPLSVRVWRFKNKSNSSKIRDFQRRDGIGLNNKQEFNFTLDDVLNKLNGDYTCYLSGLKINIEDSTSFAFDHIFPASRGGDNNLDNLGLTNSIVNKMKNNLTVDEFLSYCKIILEYNGYIVKKFGE